jgi:acetyl-CoA carboxylase biotin carboxyl carrier protein
MTDIITDTRALLRLFRQSGYADIHLRSGDYELFVATPNGGANPLHAPVAVEARPALPMPVPAEAAKAEQLVSAPHIASFVSALAVGSAVAAGDAVARIEVLGEPIDLCADQPGLVTEVLAEPSALIEYAAPLVRLLAA